MKTLFTFLLLTFCITSFARNDISERISVKKDQLLKIDLPTGAKIKINTWDENVVEAKMQVPDCNDGDCNISLSSTSYGGLIKSHFKNQGRRKSNQANVEINVMIPEYFNLEISSNGGNVSVSGLNGNLEGRTNGGGVFLTGFNGKVKFSTGGGVISVNGGNLDASFSTGGGIINIEDAIAEGSFSTGGGNIMISNTRFEGRASTGGGSINADGLSGSLTAGTGAGNIKIEVAKPSLNENLRLDLGTGSGKVELKVPSEMDPNISVELAFTNNKSSYEIKSDYDLEIEETNEWDKSKGSPRKYIYGNLTSRNSLQNISIKNVNGDVEIIKY